MVDDSHPLLSSMKVKPIAAVLLFFMVAACANPVVVPPAGEVEAALDCEALKTEIASAKQAAIDARSEDRAKAAYLLVVPGFVSWYRMDKAEKAAHARQAQLEKIAAEKKCEPITVTKETPAESPANSAGNSATPTL